MKRIIIALAVVLGLAAVPTAVIAATGNAPELKAPAPAATFHAGTAFQRGESVGAAEQKQRDCRYVTEYDPSNTRLVMAICG